LLIDADTDPQLAEVLKNWNVELGQDRVLDISGVGSLFGAGPAAPVVQSYGSHPITKDLSNTMTFFPLARSVKAGSGRSEVTTIELLKTTKASWAETDLKGAQAKFDEGQDTQGPISLGVAASKRVGDKEARLVVVGDSDFAADGPVRVLGNGDLALNMINWLAQDEDLIAIRPKSPTNRGISLTPGQVTWLKWLFIALMPLAVIGSGAYVWWKRR
jgi:ABC-type uncharacterized transport system involved in gliding motility auxiliary subunit